MADHAGKVEYLLRANDENIESDLERANKKVEKAAEKSADTTVKIEKEKTSELNKEADKIVKNTEKAADDVSDAWKTTGQEAKTAMSDIAEDKNIEIDVEADTKAAESSIDRVSRDKSIDIDARADVSGAKSDIASLGDAGKEAANEIESELKKAFNNIGDTAKNAFTDMTTSSLPLGDKIGSLTSGLSGTGAMALGLGTAFVGVGVAGVKVADDLKGAMNDFAAVTGLGAEETERYQGILEDVYANNYGESFEDIAGALGTIRQQIGPVVDSWDDESLQGFTESAFALRDAFEYDISESMRAVNAMMDQFGIDGQDAMDLIAAGAQNGLDYSGELLDSISEYSVHFGNLGIYADDMFKIFQKGADSGAFSLDKIGDAMKEFSIRVLDGSDTTKQGFELIGLNADEMAAKFSAGGDIAKEAFDETIAALAEMEDPLEQNQAGVDLFGTMWEDLGADAVTALAEIEDGTYAVGDELENLKDIKYDDLGSMFESLGRAVELALVPIGEALMPVLMTLIETVLPIINGLLTPLLELIGAFIEPVLTVVSEALQPLMDAITFLMEEVLNPLMELLQAVVLPVFESVMSVISGVVGGAISNVVNVLKGLIEFIADVFTGNWEGAWEHIKNIFRKLLPGIDGIIGGIKRAFSGIIDFISGIFTGDWKKAWNGIKNIFGGIWESMKGLFKTPINWIISGINKFIRGLNKIKIPDWVPGLGGKGINIKEIPKLKVGLDYVPSDDFPALLHTGEMVLTKEDSDILRSFGGVRGIEEFLSYSGRQSDVSNSLYMQDIKSPRGIKTYVFNSTIEMDAKAVAKATSKYTDTELAKLETMTRRGV